MGYRMIRTYSVIRCCFLLFSLCFSASIFAGQWDSSIAGEWLAFSDNAVFAGEENSYLSAAVDTEYYNEWNDGDDLFTFKPFFRFDQYDDERTHGDIRELSWIHASDDWEIQAGISKVFWGVTETIHLVDVINQSDTVENVDGEDKLGQPMINVTLIRDWGVVSAFVLPGFRERTFPGLRGRPRFGILIDTDASVYEDSDKQREIDFALRYTHTLGDWDVGISHFSGTSREPRFVLSGPVVLGIPTAVAPLYEQINQTGIDLLANIGSWQWKLEAINRSGQGKTFIAAAGGFEYTFVGVFESDMDIGLISEYLYDGREDDVTTSPFTSSPFQNDFVLGTRIVLNDAESSELLMSVIVDLEGEGNNFNIEGSRRIGDNMKLSIEARGVSNIKAGSILESFKKDNRVRTELTVYF